MYISEQSSKVLAERRNVLLKEDRFDKAIGWNAVALGIFVWWPIGIAYYALRDRRAVIQKFINKQTNELARLKGKGSLTEKDKLKVQLCQLNIKFAKAAYDVHTKNMKQGKKRSQYRDQLDKLESQYQQQYNVLKAKIKAA